MRVLYEWGHATPLNQPAASHGWFACWDTRDAHRELGCLLWNWRPPLTAALHVLCVCVFLTVCHLGVMFLYMHIYEVLIPYEEEKPRERMPYLDFWTFQQVWLQTGLCLCPSIDILAQIASSIVYPDLVCGLDRLLLYQPLTDVSFLFFLEVRLIFVSPGAV